LVTAETRNTPTNTARHHSIRYGKLLDFLYARMPVTLRYGLWSAMDRDDDNAEHVIDREQSPGAAGKPGTRRPRSRSCWPPGPTRSTAGTSPSCSARPSGPTSTCR
jgi:hypothetical protein